MESLYQVLYQLLSANGVIRNDTDDPLGLVYIYGPVPARGIRTDTSPVTDSHINSTPHPGENSNHLNSSAVQEENSNHIDNTAAGVQSLNTVDNLNFAALDVNANSETNTNSVTLSSSVAAGDNRTSSVTIPSVPSQESTRDTDQNSSSSQQSNSTTMTRDSPNVDTSPADPRTELGMNEEALEDFNGIIRRTHQRFRRMSSASPPSSPTRIVADANIAWDKLPAYLQEAMTQEAIRRCGRRHLLPAMLSLEVLESTVALRLSAIRRQWQALADMAAEETSTDDDDDDDGAETLSAEEEAPYTPDHSAPASDSEDSDMYGGF
ncbi:hypothetical protein ABEF93_005055 [Exophiala dermatitidis]